MKKAKIMLTAITVLAIVGGALAFKAKTFSTAYCTTRTTGFVKNGQGVDTCPASIGAGKTTLPPFGATYYYTVTANPAQCLQVINGVQVGAPCNSSTTLTHE